jgi:hypothetical protein
MLQIFNFGGHMHRTLQNYYLLFPEDDIFSIRWFLLSFYVFFIVLSNVLQCFTVHKVIFHNSISNVYFIASILQLHCSFNDFSFYTMNKAQWLCILAIITTVTGKCLVNHRTVSIFRPYCRSWNLIV